MVDLRFDFPSNNEPALKGNFENFELAKVQEQVSGGKIIMESGTANGSFGGMINSELIDLLIVIIITTITYLGPTMLGLKNGCQPRISLVFLI